VIEWRTLRREPATSSGRSEAKSRPQHISTAPILERQRLGSVSKLRDAGAAGQTVTVSLHAGMRETIPSSDWILLWSAA
jgi:hypothetical protein